jgi:putative acetyltransferase
MAVMGRIEVRQETEDDFDAVRRVHTEAFDRHQRAGARPPEVALTDELRASPEFIPELSLVADNGQLVVGHVIATRATVGPEASPVLGLGPLGILPSHQRQGVGVALMEAIVGVAESMGEPMIVLLGLPAYYNRFGFELASGYGIEPPEPVWAPNFLARPGRTYDPAARGLFTYAEPFSHLPTDPSGVVDQPA